MSTFTPQSITIELRKPEETPVTFDAMVAVGTGLAYHRRYAGAGKFKRDCYDITHIPSGWTIVPNGLPSEADAQHFLELLLPLADWTLSSDAIQETHDIQELQQLAQDAYRQARVRWQVRV